LKATGLLDPSEQKSIYKKILSDKDIAIRELTQAAYVFLFS